MSTASNYVLAISVCTFDGTNFRYSLRSSSHIAFSGAHTLKCKKIGSMQSANVTNAFCSCAHQRAVSGCYSWSKILFWKASEEGVHTSHLFLRRGADSSWKNEVNCASPDLVRVHSRADGDGVVGRTRNWVEGCVSQQQFTSCVSCVTDYTRPSVEAVTCSHAE